MKLKSTIVILLMMITGTILAQKGTLTGVIQDKEFNDVLPFANVIVKGTNSGTTTDFEGAYELTLEPGNYVIVFSFIGYETIEVTDVVINPGKVTELNTSLGPLSNQLDEVVVSVKTAENTEASMLDVQRRSVNLLDGMSAQSFKKVGASNLASAVRNVPGVSVQGGKYVYVRGLGDRYTKSILNGVDIPGLDPDRNTVQMDIFPTNILENVQVVKSSTADLPADFTGGMVNIITKELPNSEEYSVSLGIQYNPNMSFNSNFLSSQGSNGDKFGFDSGLRTLPINRQQYIPTPSDKNPLLTVITEQFNPEMKAKRKDSYMDTNFGFTAGNQFNIGEDKKLGYLASFSYREQYIFYENFENGYYRKSSDKSVNELELATGQIGDVGRNNILWSGLAGLTLKTTKSKYKLNFMHIQNGLSTAGYLQQRILFADAVEVFKDNIEYKQSQISNALLTGKHSNEDGSWVTEWKLSPTYSRIDDKDVRVTPFRYEPDTDIYSISPSSAGNPSRIWRNLEEINAVGNVNVQKRHTLFNKQAKLIFGGAYTFKNRDFSIDNYRIRLQGGAGQEFRGNADALLEPENIWTVKSGIGSYVEGNFEPANTYDATQTVAAVFVSEEFQITEKLKSILGVRFEKFDHYYTGQNNFGDVVYDNQKVLDKADFFPSLNLIYGVTDHTNLRMSYARTTARPSFKEASIVQIFDPLSSLTFNGNIDLQPTYVDNMDLRYERFGTNTQMFAVSGFFKNFTDPIELTYFLSATDQLQPKNLGNAIVYGAEFEVRKDFGFFGEAWEDLNFSMNLSLIKSELEMSEEELEARRLSLRDGERLEKTRELQGQSPYLVNFGFSYGNDEGGWQAGLFYNMQGETLEVVGTGDVPDVYTMPFHSLNFNLTKSFGKELNSSINFGIKNILDDDLESKYQSFKAQDQIFSRLSPGRGISLGYAYKF
ncbi:TonB-dependent receptor [Namhaeicola litoreus]|uniref:TonB-dependent receptor domain-containing protein n=1 Tax=Namhaeicola litoreus TaxID=1052145 RepID=A0ABW3Y191_9FLAO